MGEAENMSDFVPPPVLLRSQLHSLRPSDPVWGEDLSPPGEEGGRELVPAPYLL